MDSIRPITLSDTNFTGVLPSGAVGRGFIKREIWQQTTYPNGSKVTNVYYNTIEIYDSRAVVTKHNQPNQLDMMA